MSRDFWIATSFLLIVVPTLGFLGNKYIQNKYLQGKNILPIELSSGFDPTVNMPVFSIKKINRTAKIMNLVMIFPEQKNKEEIETRISCDNLDVDKMFVELESKLKDSTIISGLCTDKECIEINRDCEINYYE